MAAETGLPGIPRVDTTALERELRSAVSGEVRFDEGSRGAYATDSSNYRQVPIAVVVPRTPEDGATAIRTCREHDAPVLSRGGGTSLGGQCANVAVVIDWTKYCDSLLSVDPHERTCVVEPGLVLDDLNRALGRHGLRFGPQPSTHSHCSIGGMIGNNSCGASAQRYGKTVDNIRRLEVLTYGGLRCWLGPLTESELESTIAEGGEVGRIHQELRDLRDRYRAEIQASYPDIPRRVSGYNLDSLLRPDGLDAAGLLVGSEGTLATVLRAELELVPTVPYKALVVLGYDDIVTAADAVPDVLAELNPLILEAVGPELVHFIREEGLFEDSLELLPEGSGWLFVQTGGESVEQADEGVDRLLSGLGKSREEHDVAVSDDPDREERMLKAREAGLAATADPPDMPESWPGWEDSAVPPDRLGDYLRDLLALFDEFGYERPALYGHFGHGCLHVRIPFRLKSGPGVATYRGFVEHAADLVASHGGSLSGEHGDGQARGELLVRMFGTETVRAFGELKGIFDPDNRMNPGKVVAPYRADENLRLGSDYRPWHPETFLGYPDDHADFHQGVMRCVGIGNCRSSTGGVMCPSYRATGEEKHSTRGRARLLFEMMRGNEDSPITNGWRSEAVMESLDLCLSCKGCKSDCPTGVDMATYKAEFLAQHYRHRLRPASHYSLGWMPVLAQVARFAPHLVNTVLHAPGIAGVGKRLAGVTPHREAPEFARHGFQDQWLRRGSAEPSPGDDDAVVLWPDTFTNHFEPHIARAAVRVLEAAGFRVAVPTEPVCCGLTWISTGQLGIAGRVLRRTLRVLRPWIEAGTPVVGIEPSCTAVFRSDTRDLFPHDEEAARVRAHFLTLAEALTDHAPNELSRSVPDTEALVQTHCHQHAVLGFSADRTIMRRAGLHPEVLDSGCCGLAGNFGFERGHYDVSMACAEHALLPALRNTDPEGLVLADGFSCRTQIAHGSRHRARHLAEVLDPERKPLR
ncbi:FAD/FMN-containing dehydrogenase [Actinopolyspora alba]|uniref:FAD/FMN-containing dehydrogenase n=1 Tax=Actinopolyspora alba TaxID=673379 RepID=A0A1I2ADC9_9ACTN|nr:FAD-binding and (Fe-S)-binding domain-containing protein [Actinopolyspora alba]SFE41829.1 FAD/FMN-containing dehydrogenase [Actinopolyspora alba]